MRRLTIPGDNQSRVSLPKIYWLWLALGIVLAGYGVNTGGGLAGLLFYWELETFGTVFPDTHLLLSIPLIFFPIIGLAMCADRHRTGHIDVAANAKRLGKWFTAAGLILLSGAGLCYWRTTLFPGPLSPLHRIVLDDIPASHPVAECRSIVIGAPQPDYNVRYQEVMRGRFGINSREYHNFVPVTRSDWNRSEPVRFLIDTNGDPLSLAFSPDIGQRYITGHGLLLRGQLPGFVRRALQKKGLLIADDVMIFSSRRDFGRTPWYVATALCSIGAFISLAMGWAWPRARQRPAKEIAAVRLRVAQYLAIGIGAVLILTSLLLAVQKVKRVTSANSTEGIIVETQEASNLISRYSFYVEYSTPEGHFQRFARTWSPFAKNVGDHVVVIYGSGAPQNPTILTFDDEWVGDTLIFLVGVLIVARAMLFPKRRTGARKLSPAV